MARHKKNFVHVEFDCTSGQLCVYTQRDLINPVHSKMIGRSMAALPPLLSPSSIRPPPCFMSLRFYCRQKKFGALFKKVTVSVFLIV